MKMAAPRLRHGGRIVPVCEPPRKLIAAMVEAGAQREELAGENLRIVRIEGLVSRAWRLYVDWACSLGEVAPLVQAVFAPTMVIDSSPSSPPVLQIQIEANSIVHHVAHLVMTDFAAGMPALPGPLPAPMMMTNVRDASVAVTVLLEAISDPGAKYPAINDLEAGAYICHVQYGWRGAFITVPVFRS